MPATAEDLVEQLTSRVRGALVPEHFSRGQFDAVIAGLRPQIVATLSSQLERLPWGGWVRDDELGGWAGRRVRLVGDGKEGELVELQAGGTIARVQFAGGMVTVRGAELAVVDDVDVATGHDAPTKRAARLKANKVALEVLAKGPPFTAAERQQLRHFTGFGNLSVDAVRAVWPHDLPPPSPRSLEDEFYTPEILSAAIAGLVAPRLAGLTDETGQVLALEPAAGIGRLLLQEPRVRWVAVEYSAVSSRFLKALYPAVEVHNMPFEKFYLERGNEWFQRFGLVVANPPYSSHRGAAAYDDPDRSTRKLNGSQYFMLRGLELLRPGGLAVFVVQHTLLTGSKFAAFRAQLLLRGHLAAAFRLPSSVFGTVVTDVWVLRARGGQLAKNDEADQFIIDGKYFEVHPWYLLGRETMEPGTRRGYQVEGEFTGFPPFDERPACDCAVTQFAKAWLRSALQERVDEERLSPETLKARSLGQRVTDYARREATGEQIGVGAWQAIADELAEWSNHFGNPWSNPEVRALANSDPHVGRFAGLFSQRGTLSTEWLSQPRQELRQQPRDFLEVAEHLWQRNRVVRLADAIAAHRDAGLGELTVEAAVALLEPGGWAIDFLGDGFAVLPMRHFLTGDLWARVDAARGFAREHSGALQQLAARQLARLMATIAPVPFAALEEVSPKFAWVPLSMLSEWVSAVLNRGRSLALNDSGMFVVAGEAAPEKRSHTDLQQLLLGWLNDDLQAFAPDEGLATKYGVDIEKWDDKEAAKALPSKTQAIREKMHAAWTASFKTWLTEEEERQSFYAEAWNRRFRGWVTPEYPRELPLPVGWSSDVKPHWWQFEGAARFIDQRGGLVAYDVGLGKTLTAILMIALGKEQGRMRRPIIVVPNTVVWQWVAEIRRAVPHFRVGVVGSKLTVKKDGKILDANDSPEERQQKWLAFQRGLYDVALVTATAFPRVSVDTEALEPFYREMRDFLRLAFEEKQRLTAQKKRLLKQQQAGQESDDPDDEPDDDDDDDDGDDGDGGDERAKKKKSWTERDEARLVQDLAGFLRELNELPPRQKPDPGVVWQDLGCDCLVVDEAQRYKGLFMPPAIDGGTPKFMGAAQTGSRRAWQLHARAAAVRQAHGDTGVYLLSATPAKNSPLEFYNAFCYLSSRVWAERGITTHLSFVHRFCLFGFVQTLNTKLEPEGKMALVGFKHLDELRAVLFQRAAFYNAEQVGLPLPRAEVETIRVPMSNRQLALYDVEVTRLRNAISSRKRSEILKALANMSLIATHADLIDRITVRTKRGPEQKPYWGWNNAHNNPNFRSAKFDRCASQIMAQPDCNHLVFLQSIAAQAWFVETLVARGMPRDQILVMNAETAPRPAQRRQMALAFTGSPPTPDGEQEIPPTHRILVANEVAYEGVNLQTVTCAVHHIDTPWEPATLQQRNGRAVRQGNNRALVNLYYYLADGSADGLRFAAITGKLRWMEVLIQGTDRDTNNPAAQQDMSASELTLALARDPAQLKSLQETLRAESLREDLTKLVKQVPRHINTVRGLLSDAANAEPVEAARMRADARTAWEGLRATIPEQLRHMMRAATRVIYSRPVQALGATLIWPGLVVRLEGGAVELGYSTDTHVVLRREGSAEWERQPASLLTSWEVVTEDDVVQLRLPLADSDYDVPLVEPQLEGVLQRHAERRLSVNGDWTRLEWEAASEEFRARAWAAVGDFVTARVRAYKGVPLPAIREGQLLLLTGGDLDGAAVLPWTAAGFERALSVPLHASVKVADMVRTSRDYWGRTFRRTREASTTAPEDHPVLGQVEEALRGQGFAVDRDGVQLHVGRDGVRLGTVWFARRLRWEPAAAAAGAEEFQARQVPAVTKELQRCCDISQVSF